VSPITSDSVEAGEAPPGTPSGSRLSATPEWLLRVSIESVLIVISILLALAVDQWRENRSNRLLARQSLQIFEREVRRNLTALEEVIPYHTGLRDVAVAMAAQPERVVEVRSIVEGLKPVVLLNTAWETALATGALRHIDVETVSALSLTYSMQQRFREEVRAGLPRLLPSGDADAREMQQAIAYLTEMGRSEDELRGVYLQALEVITQAIGADTTRADTAGNTGSAQTR
jgi:hypothetical protein